jgi:FkbM family methyltransferase
VVALAHRVFRRFGFDIIRYPLGTSEGLAFANLADSLGVEAVVDVGANAGQFGSLLRARGFRGRIISFEPGRDAFAALERASANDRLWSVHMLALGSANETRDLLVPGGTDLASFLSASDRGQRAFGRLISEPSHEQAQVRRLDSGFEELVGVDRLMLKIDTQGFDQEVLEGATDVLERVVGLQTEMAIHHYYDGVPGYLIRLQWLQEHGYDPVAFAPAADEGGVLTEFDCLLVRRPSGPSS